MLEMMQNFVRDNPDHEALDEEVVIRIQTNEDNGDELHVGGLRSLVVDAGCTDTCALTLDADQEPAMETDSSTTILDEDQDVDGETDASASESKTSTDPEIFLEIIVRGGAEADKTALAHLIRRTLAVVGFSVKFTDSADDHIPNEIQTLRFASTVQQLTSAQHRIHIRTEA